MKHLPAPFLLALGLLAMATAKAHDLPTPAEIDVEARALMQRTGAQGVAIAVIDRDGPRASMDDQSPTGSTCQRVSTRTGM